VLALLAMLSGVEQQQVETVAGVAVGVQQLLLGRGQQSGRGLGRAQPAQQPTGMACLVQDRACCFAGGAA